MNEAGQNRLLGMSFQELRGLVSELGEPPYRARQLFDSVYAQRQSDVSQFSTLPKELRSALAARALSVGMPAISRRFVSTDGTVRYLIGLEDGQTVEAVWMPDGDQGEAGDGSPAGDEEETESADKSY